MTKTWISSYFGNYSFLLPQNNYHFKECHNSFVVFGSQEVMYVLYLMVGWLKSIEYLGIRCCTNSLHRSLSHTSARLCHKNRDFYFSFKFGILGLLHQWSLHIAYIRGGKDSQRESFCSS